jgi:hypothetical protein
MIDTHLRAWLQGPLQALSSSNSFGAIVGQAPTNPISITEKAPDQLIGGTSFRDGRHGFVPASQRRDRPGEQPGAGLAGANG